MVEIIATYKVQLPGFSHIETWSSILIQKDYDLDCNICLSHVTVQLKCYISMYRLCIFSEQFCVLLLLRVYR